METAGEKSETLFSCHEYCGGCLSAYHHHRAVREVQPARRHRKILTDAVVFPRPR